MNRNKSFIERLPIWKLITITVLIIFLWILTALLPTPWNYLNLTETGQIGDTIGGLTSPVVGILGAVLLSCIYRTKKIE